MIRIYPKETVKMLHVRNVGPFKILNKLNCNTYIINLLRDYDISCTFTVNDLMDCKDFDCNLLIDKHSPKPFSESPSISSLQILIPLQQRELIKF